MTKITDTMRQQANPLWEASFNHPFIEQLSTGALSPQTFRYYLKRNRFYLENFAALHGKIADQIDNPDIKAFLYAGAEGFNDSEKEIRKEFFSELKITQEEIDKTHIAPTAYSYVAHMYHELNEGTPAGPPRRCCRAIGYTTKSAKSSFNQAHQLKSISGSLKHMKVPILQRRLTR